MKLAAPTDDGARRGEATVAITDKKLKQFGNTETVPVGGPRGDREKRQEGKKVEENGSEDRKRVGKKDPKISRRRRAWPGQIAFSLILLVIFSVTTGACFAVAARPVVPLPPTSGEPLLPGTSGGLVPKEQKTDEGKHTDLNNFLPPFP